MSNGGGCLGMNCGMVEGCGAVIMLGFGRLVNGQLYPRGFNWILQFIRKLFNYQNLGNQSVLKLVIPYDTAYL